MKHRINCKYVVKLLVLMVCLLFLGKATSAEVNAASEEYVSGSWRYTVSNGNAKITKYSGSASTVSIPSSLDGHTVTEIGPGAFWDCSSLTRVSIPDTVTTLWNDIFSGTSITELTIPKSVVTCYRSFSSGSARYGNGPIGGAEKLRKVIFAEGMTKIPEHALCSRYTESALTTVVIPDSVTKIGEKAFQYCTSLSNVNLPKNLTFIGAYTFEDCKSLSVISFTENADTSVKMSIGECAFLNCTSLSSVRFSDNVTELGNSVFSGCESLYSLNLPKKLEKLGYCIIAKTPITKLTFPKTLNTCYRSYSSSSVGYGPGPIGGAENLKEVEFEDGMETIPGNALNSRYTESTLTTVVIPDSVTTIGENAFRYCTALKTVDLPSKIASIEGCAFNECNSLQSITFPKSLSNLGEHSFYNCVSLKSVVFTDNGTDDFSLKIRNEAFSGCPSLETVKLNRNVTSIGNGAFGGCTSLTEIDLPESLTALGYNFIYKTGITEIEIPKNLVSCTRLYSSPSYYSGPLGGATSLKKVIFQEGMSKIPDNILDCTGQNEMIVDTVVIPDTVSAIGKDAFRNCTSITQITLPNYICSIESGAFYGCTGLKSLVFEEGGEDTPVSIGANAFYGCTALTKLHFSNRIGNVGALAFYNCTAITEVQFGNNVTSIQSAAFRGCTNLKTVSFGDSCTYAETKTSGEKVITGGSLTSVGSGAFYGCTSLTGTLAFPSSLKTIGDNAFYNCTGITKMYFAGAFPSIGSNAFSGITADAFYRDNNTKWSTLHAATDRSTYQYGGTIQWKVWQDFWLIQNAPAYFSSSDLGYYMNQPDYAKLINSLASPTDVFNICFQIEPVTSDDGAVTEDSLLPRINVDGKYEQFLKWSGSCYGLSVSSILVNNGTLAPENIFENTEYLFDLSSEYAIDSVINFYHAQQKHASIIRRLDRCLRTPNETIVKELADSVGKGMVLIDYGWYNQKLQGTSAHAVVGYGKEDGRWTKEGKNYCHRIIIYDCAYPNQEDSYLYYNEDGSWCVPYQKVSGLTQNVSQDSLEDNGFLTFLPANSKLLDIVDYKTGALYKEPYTLPEPNVYLFTNNEELEVSTDNSAFTYDRLFTRMERGTEEVRSWVMADEETGESGNREAIISVPKGEYYEIASKKKGLTVKIMDGDQIRWAVTEDPGKVRFETDQKITLDCENSSGFTVGLLSTDSSGTNEKQYELHGKSTAPISFQLTEKGLEVEGEDLTEFRVDVVKNDTRKTISLATDQDSVLVVDDENGNLTAKSKNQGDKDYNENLLDTRTCNHDYQMTVTKEATATQPGMQMNVCKHCHKRDTENKKEIPATKDLTGCKIKIAETSFEYAGVPVKPEISLYDGTYLVEHSVYQVTYTDNDDIGKAAKIHVNGVNGYTGSVEADFQIIHTYHKWDGGTITQKATIEKEGIRTYHCQYCDETKTEKIPKLTPPPSSSSSSGSKPTTSVNTVKKPVSVKVTVPVPKMSSAKNYSSKKILVKWKRIKGVSGYQLQYALNSKYKKAKTVTIKKSSITSKKLTKLKKRKKYYLRIRAYRVKGGKKYYSKWSKTRKVTVKK